MTCAKCQQPFKWGRGCSRGKLALLSNAGMTITKYTMCVPCTSASKKGTMTLCQRCHRTKDRDDCLACTCKAPAAVVPRKLLQDLRFTAQCWLKDGTGLPPSKGLARALLSVVEHYEASRAKLRA